MIKKYLNRIFIDGLSGMAYGLFATLIIGTIISQIGGIIGESTYIGGVLIAIGGFAKTVTGAGIGVGTAAKLKASPLTTVSAAVCGMIGAFPDLSKFKFSMPGEPLGAFIAAFVAIEIGSLVSGKTKLEIIITPLSCILSGAAVGLLVGPYISSAMNWIGHIININVDKHPVVGGSVISVAMGMLLTLPISSAAIGYIMGLKGLAAGAATVGCCCNMIGFAVISYRENKFGGLVAQGVGTSMIQMPNIIKHPIIWLPSILSSALLGPLSSAVFKMENTEIGCGMGSAGLVGQFEAFSANMKAGTSLAGANPAVVVLLIILMQFILPAVLALSISFALKKMGLIKDGYMKLQDISHA